MIHDNNFLMSPRDMVQMPLEEIYKALGITAAQRENKMNTLKKSLNLKNILDSQKNVASDYSICSDIIRQVLEPYHGYGDIFLQTVYTENKVEFSLIERMKFIVSAYVTNCVAVSDYSMIATIMVKFCDTGYKPFVITVEKSMISAGSPSIINRNIKNDFEDYIVKGMVQYL